MTKNLSILSHAILMMVLIGCSSSETNPGFSVHSTPDDFKADVARTCGAKYNEWVDLSNIPIRPTLGTSKIKQILSAIHNIGLAHVEGCPKIGVAKDHVKAFIYLQLANDFEYIPTRFVLGKALIDGHVIQKDVNLGRDYLQQVIFCDQSYGFKYGEEAKTFLQEANQPFSADASQFDKNCNQIRGAYFKGPTTDFDALAYKTDWEGRSATLNQNWGWLGAGFRGTTTFIEAALPVALAGAAVYYSAKLSQQYQAIPMYSLPPPAPTPRPTANVAFSTGSKVTNVSNVRSGNQLLTSKNECTSDFQCGLGRVCVKPQGGLSLTGLCATLVDTNGAPTYTVPVPSAGPHQISACTFDTSCPVGFRCEKVGNAMTGVCVRQ